MGTCCHKVFELHKDRIQCWRGFQFIYILKGIAAQALRVYRIVLATCNAHAPFYMGCIANMQWEIFLAAVLPDEAMIHTSIFYYQQAVFIKGYSMGFKPLIQAFNARRRI